MFWTPAAQRGPVGLLSCWSLTARCLTPPRCSPLTSRSCSSSVPEEPQTHESVKTSLLRRWTLSVSPFATAKVQLGCNISVQPLDPHAHPESDRVLITVHGPESSDLRDFLNHLQVHYDEQSKELRIMSAEKVKNDVTIQLEAPIKTNLFINAEGKGEVHVKNMECDVCKVQTQTGNCLLHSVKGHQVEVQSHGGHVTGVGTIHGDVSINTGGDGKVDVKKLQGTTMSVSTERGPLKVKALYAGSSCVTSCSGRVELGLVHGNAEVQSASGDIVIDGSNSFLKVSSNSGDIDVYVGEGGAAELHSQEGAVSVRVPSSLRVGVDLCGALVDISPEVFLLGVKNTTTDSSTALTGYLNEEPPADRWVKAQADRRSVKLRTQSWFESLKLGS